MSKRLTMYVSMGYVCVSVNVSVIVSASGRVSVSYVVT